jgi:Leucine-rich repeat (LRR) protein
VVGGNASISATGSTLNINQSSNRAAIDWNRGDAESRSLARLEERLRSTAEGRAVLAPHLMGSSSAPSGGLISLDLRQTKITDAGLESLIGLKKLQTLNLYGTEITDAGLKHLAKIKSLKNVYLWQSKATKAGVKQLIAAVPGLKATVE